MGLAIEESNIQLTGRIEEYANEEIMPHVFMFVWLRFD